MPKTDYLTKLGKEGKMSILRRMLRIRRFEEALMEYVADGHPIGGYFVSVGQEGSAAAVMEAAHPHDRFLTHHRNHGHIIARGSDAAKTYAELLGRSIGHLGGRGGGFHLADHHLGFLQTSGIVGGSISLLTGAAFAAKQLGGDQAAFGFFGDSAMEEGIAYEALNIAKLWNLPAIFICENNNPGALGAAQGGMPALVHAAQSLTAIADVLSVRSMLVDGSKVGDVYAAVCEARALCLAGEGPVFLEIPNERWTGSQSILPKFQGRTSIEAFCGDREAEGADADWVNRSDPITHWIREIIATGTAERAELLQIDAEIRSEMKTALDVAIAAPMPDPSTALEKVYA